jgi:dimethylhistidine N-methyltransferase
MTLRHSSQGSGALDSWSFETGFARDVYEGLCTPQKILPAKYLYDEVGSALFEAITLLPEYGLTRAEERLLRANANEIAWRMEPIAAVAELGSGNGAKTGTLLEAIAGIQRHVDYFAIDLSTAALDHCRAHLQRIPGVDIHTIAASYLDGLAAIRKQEGARGRMLLLFLGSSLGNLAGDEAILFFRNVRQYLTAGDAILVGADLVKTPGALLNAYADPAGVTSAFNLNLLSRINRELGGDFQLRSFRHDARWLPGLNRIEMHLVSQDRQVVRVRESGCLATFEPGESIWTETSQKFTLTSLAEIAARAGLSVRAQWIDLEWPFAESLWFVE